MVVDKIGFRGNKKSKEIASIVHKRDLIHSKLRCNFQTQVF